MWCFCFVLYCIEWIITGAWWFIVRFGRGAGMGLLAGQTTIMHPSQRPGSLIVFILVVNRHLCFLFRHVHLMSFLIIFPLPLPFIGNWLKREANPVISKPVNKIYMDQDLFHIMNDVYIGLQLLSTKNQKNIFSNGLPDGNMLFRLSLEHLPFSLYL